MARAECTPLEPAPEQLVECRIFWIAAVEAADIGRPPRNPSNPHVEPGGQLTPKRRPT